VAVMGEFVQRRWGHRGQAAGLD